MAQGPILIFDKSSLESLNLDEAVLLDNFYRSNITPLFFVECLADLEKAIKSRSTPEQLVGSLADRTPEAQSCANTHHMRILKGELSGQFKLDTVFRRPILEGGKAVQLGDVRGMIFKRSQEEEALHRWAKRDFFDVERDAAKQWRKALAQIDFDVMGRHVMAEIGHWKKSKSLADAKQITDAIIDNMDPEWLLGFGMDLLGVSDGIEWVRKDWIVKRRPSLREQYPYFIFMLSINIFFCLVLPTQLLRDVKQSHQIDLAYLYYLPFCMVFTSKDRFHDQIVPFFIGPDQTFVNSADLKEDLKKLHEHYASMPEDVLKTGLMTFAVVPPEDTSFLITRLWDKYLPSWRNRPQHFDLNDPEYQKKTMEMIDSFDEGSEGVHSHDEHDVDKLDHVTIKRTVRARKGSYRRFSEEAEEQMKKSSDKPSAE